MKNDLTGEQIHIMEHALGLVHVKFPNTNWKSKTILKKCYRNRYIVGKDWKPIKELVEKGYMERVRDDSLGNGNWFHYVTEKGVDYLKDIVMEVRSR